MLQQRIIWTFHLIKALSVKLYKQKYKISDNKIIVCSSRNSEYTPQQRLYRPYEVIYSKWENVLDKYYDRSSET